MRRSRRRMRLERLESRALLAATVGISDLVVNPSGTGSRAVASIEVDGAEGVRAASVEIHYDPDQLQADMGSVRAGSIWNGKGVAIANVDDGDGKITAFLFATQSMDLARGSLVDIDFIVRDESAVDSQAAIGLRNLRLNEGDLAVDELADRGQPVAGIQPRAERSDGANDQQRPVPAKDQRSVCTPSPGRSAAALALSAAETPAPQDMQRRLRLHGPLPMPPFAAPFPAESAESVEGPSSRSR